MTARHPQNDGRMNSRRHRIEQNRIFSTDGRAPGYPRRGKSRQLKETLTVTVSLRSPKPRQRCLAEAGCGNPPVENDGCNNRIVLLLFVGLPRLRRHSPYSVGISGRYALSSCGGSSSPQRAPARWGPRSEPRNDASMNRYLLLKNHCHSEAAVPPKNLNVPLSLLVRFLTSFGMTY